MKKNAGVWIDERKAIIVRFTDSGEEIHSVLFEMEKKSIDLQESSNDKRDTIFPTHLKEYYEKVIALLRGAEDVLILGPGMAKVELSIRLKGDTLGEHIAGIENEDAMSDAKIVSRVRKHFISSVV